MRLQSGLSVLLAIVVTIVQANSQANLYKRARDWRCGQIKSNDATFPNKCICFDALGLQTVAGESVAVVAYSNANMFRYPASVNNVLSADADQMLR